MRLYICVIYNNIDVINTAVVSMVGVVCFRKREVGNQEVGGCLGIVLSCVETVVVPMVGVVCFW